MLKKLLLLLAVSTPVFAQSYSFTGTKVLDASGNLLSFGSVCFATVCYTVTNGAIAPGYTTAGGTGALTVNTASANIFTATGVTIASNFNLDTFVVTGSASGVGTPHIACAIGATFTQTDGGLGWNCASRNGLAVWVTSGTGNPSPSGMYAGIGNPTFFCTSPCHYTRADASPASDAGYDLVATYGTVSSNWALQGSASSPTASNIATAIQGQSACTTAGNLWSPATNTCIPGGSVTASSIASAIQGQAACTISGNLWSPANNTCLAGAAVTPLTVAQAIQPQQSCGISGYYWSPASNTCLAPAPYPSADVIAGSIQGQSSCTVSGTVWSPASNTCITAPAPTASSIAAAITTITSCQYAGYVWSPSTNTCSQPVSGSAITSAIVTSGSNCQNASYYWAPGSNQCLPGTTPGQAPSLQTLVDASSITWIEGYVMGGTAILQLNHTIGSRTLSISDLGAGSSANLLIQQDSTGGVTSITLGSCNNGAWFVGGTNGFTAATTLTLTSAANATNIASIQFFSTNCYVNLR